MLKDWSNVIIPEEEEINERLERARNKLVQQQILIMQKTSAFLKESYSATIRFTRKEMTTL